MADVAELKEKLHNEQLKTVELEVNLEKERKQITELEFQVELAQSQAKQDVKAISYELQQAKPLKVYNERLQKEIQELKEQMETR